MTPEEVDAVVGHELGHARGHHVLLKLVALLAVWAALQAGAFAIFGSGRSTGAAGAALVAGFFIALFVVQGAPGLFLERRADAAAAREIGAAPLASALEKLGTLYDAKRRTGLLWNMFTRHPGLENRIARLEPPTHEKQRVTQGSNPVGG